MENLITPENLEDIKELIENKIKDIPGELIIVGALGSILLSSYLNKTGHVKAASVIGSLAIPIAGIGLAKYKDLLQSKLESFEKPEQEPS